MTDKEKSAKAKEYLGNINFHNKQVVYFEEKIKKYTSLVESVTSVLSDMPKGGGSSTKDFKDSLIDLKDEYKVVAGEAKEKELLGIMLIEQLEKPLHKRILFDKYVRGITLYRISIDMDYSHQYVREAHGTALLKFYELI